LHYLVAIHREGSAVTDADRAEWASPGEPVVPTFPTGAPNTFLGLHSFREVPYAQVVAGTFDPDEWADSLKAQFPGLPGELHEAYLMETIKVAILLEPGTVVQIYTDADSARIKAVDDDAHIYTLWNQQPIPERYTR
jgi:hypothetical protein